MSKCKQCAQQFNVTTKDKVYYQRIKVPEPTLCPDCRTQRRIAWRNERSLYESKCALTDEKIISMYDPKGPYKVYSEKAWWGDGWDPMDHGRDFDFNKSFFDNFKELYLEVPKFNLVNFDQENSDYCNYSSHQKNCYLLSGCWYAENCYYGDTILYSNDCIDNFNINKCNKCYQLIDSIKCYEAFYCQQCHDCINSWFLYDCRSCQNCLFSFNLRHKQDYLFNKPASKQEIEEAKREFLSSPEKFKQAIKKFRKLIEQKAIHKYMSGDNFEDCSGDALYNCKNVYDSFYIYDGDNVVRTYRSVGGLKDSFDNYGTSTDELVYECLNVDKTQGARFCFNGENNANYDYSIECYNVKDCFGCNGLRKKQYCILNKQYEKAEYFKLKEKIIEHMKKTEEWGEFFPMSLNPFCYNETIVMDFFPLTKKDVLSKEWRWREEKTKKLDPKLPVCEECNKNFKIISAEKKFYESYNLPEPEQCPNCRIAERFKLRNPYELWDRTCTKCNKEIRSVYAPKRPEKVYCEECYNKVIY